MYGPIWAAVVTAHHLCSLCKGWGLAEYTSLLLLLLLLFPGIGAGFYLGYSWLPSFFVKHAGIPQSLTLWMVLSGMVIFTFVVPVSGPT
jgi:hypothetical protein